jgi:hypothetical protein
MSKTDESTAKRTAEKQRKLQGEIDDADRLRSSKDSNGAMQAGARRYPEPPLPKQHLVKPGNEFELEPAPCYDAPYYIGSEKLKDNVAIITGGDSGIGRSVAVLFAREGADIAIVYLQEHRDAEIGLHSTRLMLTLNALRTSERARR